MHTPTASHEIPSRIRTKRKDSHKISSAKGKAMNGFRIHLDIQTVRG
ncbi:MAG: hypothetical protein ABIQ93_10855 [Saprospiraceae bacterium]